MNRTPVAPVIETAVWQRRPVPRLISVIVPVRNGAAHLGDQLTALSSQGYGGAWEVVVADNGSRDGTAVVARSWSSALPALTVVDASSRKGINHARNVGAAAARGDFLVFCDSDDVAAPGWLEAMAVAARHADVVGGALDVGTLNHQRLQRWQPDHDLTALRHAHGFLPCVPGGNCGVWAAVARKLRWDEAYGFGSSDTEFSWRAILGGYRVHFAPDAVIQRRYRQTMTSLARQWYGYGVSGPRLFRDFKHAGVPRPTPLDVATRWWRIIAGVPDALCSCDHRGNWLRATAFNVGRLVGSFRWRVLFL